MILKNVTLIHRQAKFKRIVRDNWQRFNTGNDSFENLILERRKWRKNNKILGGEREKKLKIVNLSTTIQRRDNEASLNDKQNSRTHKGGLRELVEKEEENRNWNLVDPHWQRFRKGATTLLPYVAIARGGKFHLVEAIFSPISSLPFPCFQRFFCSLFPDQEITTVPK